MNNISLEKDHYDVALLGCWWGANYGSVLNGYAVYKILKSMGLSVLLINKHDAKPDDWEIYNTHNEKFIKKYYPPEEVSPVMTFEELSLLNKYCDTFITGSDQIWNYNINKLFKKAFMMNFVEDSKKKISFGTSLGHGKYSAPAEEIEEAKRLLQRFDAISVREKSGARICAEQFDVMAKVVIEPVFCLEREEYKELANNSDINCEKHYILSYMLDPTHEKREAIKYYEKVSGKKAINILDGDPRVFEKNFKILNLPGTTGRIGADDLLKLYENADFVITDSFHGTAFSIIYNKPFLSISNLRRGAMRFTDLLEQFDLVGRLSSNPENIEKKPDFLEAIDYTEINKKIQKEKEEALSWLKNVLNMPKSSIPPVSAPNKVVTKHLNINECVGCGACINTCPTEALYIVEDKWGFYRAAVRLEKCINCGKCKEICPALNYTKNDNKLKPECYEFVSSNDTILEQSSSGGVFTTMAKKILSEGGLVSGAAWTEDLTVKHIIIDSEKDLYKLQKSKYLQSDIGDVFKNIRRVLLCGRKVLFTGTPCQVYGLKRFLKRNFKQLIAVDLLCSNAPSPGFFKKYLSESFEKKVKSYEFRHKSKDHKWDCIHVKVSFEDGSVITRSGAREDDFQRVFHNHVMCPPHCEKCKFQSFPRIGDITIGDFWGIGNKDKSLDTSKGVSLVLCNNEKGYVFFNGIAKHEYKVKKSVPLEWMGGNGHSLTGGRNWCSPKRDQFFESIKNGTFKEAINYALKPNHGFYRSIYDRSNSSLSLDSKMLNFHFDSSVWEEVMIDGSITLIVKEGKWGKLGRFARLSLNKPLERNKKYVLSIKFKIKTTSDKINFHVIDSGSNIFQIIAIENIKNKNLGNEWIEIKKDFISQTDFFDEFMVGASQISGMNNYIMFEYINISEADC